MVASVPPTFDAKTASEDLQAIVGGVFGARRWHELTQEERQGVLDSQRLAYLDEVPVNWCPALGTVLANEEVTNEGRSERGNHPVFKRPLRQWMLRITAYADRLARTRCSARPTSCWRPSTRWWMP